MRFPLLPPSMRSLRPNHHPHSWLIAHAVLPCRTFSCSCLIQELPRSSNLVSFFFFFFFFLIIYLDFVSLYLKKYWINQAKITDLLVPYSSGFVCTNSSWRTPCIRYKMCACACARACVCVCVCVCIHIYIYICMYIYVCMYNISVYIYIYIVITIHSWNSILHFSRFRSRNLFRLFFRSYISYICPFVACDIHLYILHTWIQQYISNECTLHDTVKISFPHGSNRRANKTEKEHFLAFI